MFKALAKLGYIVMGFVQKDEITFIVMGKRTEKGPWSDREYATWEYGAAEGEVPSLFTGHYDLTFNEARLDLMKRAGLKGDDLEEGIVVERFKTDDAARIRAR